MALVCLTVGTAAGRTTGPLDEAHARHQRLLRRPAAQRSAADYEAIVSILAPVWEDDPGGKEAAQAHFDAGAVYVAEAQDLHRAAAYGKAAAQYEALLKARPYSDFRRNAVWALAQLDWYHLDQRREARHWLRDFVNRYPADPRVHVAQAQLRGVTPPQPPILPVEVKTSRPNLEPASEADHAPPASDPDVTARHRPARKDIARPMTESTPPTAPGMETALDGLHVSSTPDSASIVLDLAHEVRFERGFIPEAHRLYFDLMGADLPRQTPYSLNVRNSPVSRVRVAQNRPGVIRVVIDETPGAKSDTALFFPNPSRLVIAVHGGAPSPAPSTQGVRKEEISPDRRAGARSTAAEAHVASPEIPGANPSYATDEAHLDDAPVSQRRAATAANKFRGDHGDDDDVVDVGDQIAQPTRSGQRSLTRALGLKIGRIVLDAGHGGHDTGTIGVDDLNEKDVALDVVLRLGKLLKRRMGADVVYTRKDDTFIPLEERTAIANRVQADLFVSVHLNSSPDASARGIETYYLSLTRNAHALDVAARENASAQSSEHELQYLVKKIALQDKLEESHELAEDLQRSLASASGENSRGVKTAPFVVLIGAQMPSVLAEISFISNSEDARLLRQPAYRQKLAQALYNGILRYVHSLSGLKGTERASLNR
ncbi:MAG: N-acetylmuramoyl-L-alanine amidase [Terriglobales bacterium]